MDESLDLAGFARAARSFHEKLDRLKSEHPLTAPGWYPYSSMTAAGALVELLASDFDRIPPLVAAEPVLDVGCADGDLAFFLESLGATVDAIDYGESNYNQLAGARRLRELLESRVSIYSVNLDSYFELPRRRYGLVLFLGTLYHVKNPFYVLEALARRGAYCLLSSRIAQKTGPEGVRIEDQPVAYLLDPREANDDSTNYWIFSAAGLERLAERAGWSVVAGMSTGCKRDSNPVEAAADERRFLMLQSRVRFPEFQIRLLHGWHAMEEGGWRWTAKRFSIEVLLPRRRPAKEFALSVHLPEMLLASGGVMMRCEIQNQPCGQATYDSPGAHTFRGVVAGTAADRLTLSFAVEHGFRAAGDSRDLGVMVSFADEMAGARSGLPFRIS